MNRPIEEVLEAIEGTETFDECEDSKTISIIFKHHLRMLDTITKMVADHSIACSCHACDILKEAREIEF